jgi:hypothetical protein
MGGTYGMIMLNHLERKHKNTMATKTWKLGEICRGGIITVETKGNKVAIIGKDWDHSKGTRRGSDQKGAKEWIRCEFDTVDTAGAYRNAFNFLHDLTHSWAAEEILKWIESKTETKFFHW